MRDMLIAANAAALGLLAACAAEAMEILRADHAEGRNPDGRALLGSAAFAALSLLAAANARGSWSLGR